MIEVGVRFRWWCVGEGEEDWLRWGRGEEFKR